MPETQHFWVLILSPGTSIRGATWDLNLRRRGTSTSSAKNLDSRRQGTLTQICGAASQGPLRRESRSHVAPRVEVPGDKIKTQKC